MNFAYEKPTLKNHGTMKELTLGAGGSGGDGVMESQVGVDMAADDFNANPADPNPASGDITHDGNTTGSQGGFD